MSCFSIKVSHRGTSHKTQVPARYLKKSYAYGATVLLAEGGGGVRMSEAPLYKGAKGDTSLQRHPLAPPPENCLQGYLTDK